MQTIFQRLFGKLFFQYGKELGLPGNYADIGNVALVARAAVRQAVKGNGGFVCDGHGLIHGRMSSLRGPSRGRSEEHTSELQSLMRISYAVFCLKKKKNNQKRPSNESNTMHHT